MSGLTPRSPRRRPAAAASAATALMLLAGCTVGPDYHRPTVAVPAAYKEARGWQKARPADAVGRGRWWSIYRDPVLDRLERQIDISNQNLKAAEADFRQAEALVAQARAGYFPSAQANASATRARSGRSGAIANSFDLDASANWVPDLWGRIRRGVEGAVASAQASAGDLANARLAAQAALARDYLQLRVADELARLLTEAVRAYAEALRITRNQYRGGTADRAAVAQAEAQLAGTRAQLIAVGVTRAALEHAIAVLIGKPPAEFAIAPTTAAIAVPAIPPELPAALLQRRPDIAAAERRMAAANAEIGAAEAAFFPDVTLSGDAGVAAAMLRKLLTASAALWSFGGSLAQTVFDAGLRRAQVAEERALYDASVADYRETVLGGFQQVEDQYAALRILAEQATAQERAVAAAREAERVITNQYKAGTVAYTSVIVAETTALADAETAVNIRQSRLLASVALIEALGGGWNAAQLPSRERIERGAGALDLSPLPPADAWPRLPKLR